MKSIVLGIPFDNVTMDAAVGKAMRLVAAHAGGYVCTPNPEIVWLARKDKALQEAIAGAALVLPDGVGIVWASKKLGAPLLERVTGYDFLMAFLAEMEGRVFLLGGKPGVAEEAAAQIEMLFPRVTVVGTADGYFSENEAILRSIRAAAPNFLAVCLGSPKQELWMRENGGRLPGILMAGLGGSMDVLAGRVKRAPQKWIDCRLEWLYRLLRQPTRIKRQIRLLYFAAAVMIQRTKHD